MMPIDTSINFYERAFQRVCSNGHFHIAQRLLEIKQTINISADYDYAFQSACKHGHLHIAQWLYQINSTIDILDKETSKFNLVIKSNVNELIWLFFIFDELSE
jgi:ankyrin repeat protein